MNGLDRIIRIPGNHLIQRYHKGYNHGLGDQVHRKLDIFYQDHNLHSSTIHIGYNSFMILIITNNTVDWTKKLHECFCEKLGVMLHEVHKKEIWDFRTYNLEVNYVYIPKYYKDKWNETFSVDFDNLRL